MNETQILRKYQPENCPTCGESFTCKVANITQCACSAIKIPQTLIFLLRDQFESCLCPKCLRTVAKLNFEQVKDLDLEGLKALILSERSE